MITYDIVHHIDGRIRLKVPFIRKLIGVRNVPEHIKNLCNYSAYFQILPLLASKIRQFTSK